MSVTHMLGLLQVSRKLRCTTLGTHQRTRSLPKVLGDHIRDGYRAIRSRTGLVVLFIELLRQQHLSITSITFWGEKGFNT